MFSNLLLRIFRIYVNSLKWDYFMFELFRVFFVSALFCLLSFSASAWSLQEFTDELKVNVRDTWNCGKPSLYIPVYAWHNRLTYDQKHIDKYNENPWGLGVGKSLYEGKNWHGLYAMAFKDSNDYAETFFGYAFIKNHSLNEADTFRVGYGYTLGVTQRHEYKYIPVPAPLPIASISYRNFSINAAYVPGVKNDGNVLFSWLKIDF